MYIYIIFDVFVFKNSSTILLSERAQRTQKQYVQAMCLNIAKELQSEIQEEQTSKSSQFGDKGSPKDTVNENPVKPQEKVGRKKCLSLL